MTNTMIILQEQIKLAEEGRLKYLETYSTIVINGEEKQIHDIEAIHTYQRWKQLGYVVKKGEKAIAKFPIWKYSTKKKDTENDVENEQEAGYCFMKMSAFFSQSQVEPIIETE